MAKIVNLQKVLQQLKRMEQKAERDTDGSVIVGYTASYAIHVHENLEAKHKEGKQAKYLETPARELQKEMATTVATAVKRGVPLVKAMLLAGMFLQRASQKIVPVDTGNLRGSAFTREE